MAMVFPVDTVLVTVHGKLSKLNQAAANGHIDFDLHTPPVAVSTPLTVLPARTTAHLVNGEFTVQLPAEDGNNATPWIYRVTEHTNISTGEPFWISLDSGSSPIEYADLTVIADPTTCCLTGPEGPAPSVPYQLEGASASDPVMDIFVTGDTSDRLTVLADGTLSWGPGDGSAADVNISRNASGFQLESDSYINAPGFSITGYNGFYQARGSYAIYKPADETRASNVTLTNDTHLIIPVYAHVNHVMFEVGLFVDSNSTANFQVQIADTGVETDESNWAGYSTPVSAAADVFGGGALVAAGTNPVIKFILIKGSFHTTGVAGNVFVKWAQAVSDVGNTVVKKGSWISATLIQ